MPERLVHGFGWRFGVGAAAALSMVLMMSTVITGSAAGAHADDKGEWAFPRQDTQNSAHQSLPGAIKTPKVAARAYLGGQTEFASAMDVDADGQTELLTVEAGELIARTTELTTKWRIPGLGLADVLGMYDLDGDGTREIVAHSFYTLYVISGDGSVLWEKTFTGAITHVRIRVGQLDASLAGRQIVVWPDRVDSAFALAFDNGVAAGYELWRSAPPDRNAGDGYLPEVLIDDVNADGDNEVVAAVYGALVAYDGATGAEITNENGWAGRADWIAGPDVNGRNYGSLTLANIDTDPYLEAVVVADGVNLHLAVVQNDAAGFSLHWDKFVEFPENRKLVRATINSVGDVDGDGAVEIAANLFNDTGDERWHLLVVDAMTGFSQPEEDIADAYLWGVQDLNGDGSSELLVSRETEKAPGATGTLEIYDASGGAGYAQVWSLPNARYVIDNHVDAPGVSSYMRTAREEIMRGDVSQDGVDEFFVAQQDSLAAYQYGAGTVAPVWEETGRLELLRAGELTGDGTGDVVVQSPDGTLRLEDVTGTVHGETKLGGLEGAPTVADLDGDGEAEIVVASFGVVRVLESRGKRLVEQWSQPGWGVRQANLNFPQWTSRPGPVHSVPVFDIDDDGQKELLVADNNAAGDHTRARLLDADGSEIWSHTFEDLPATDFWSGIFSWTVGNFNGDDVLDVYVAAFTGGYNSDVSRVLDGRTGELLWGTNQPPDNDGIGFGPSGYPAVADIDGDGLDNILIVAKNKIWSIDGARGSVSRVLSGYTGLYHTPTLTDVDGDGADDYVLGGGHIGLTAIKSDGSTLWSNSSRDWEYLGRHLAVADVDGDDAPEVGALQASGLFVSLDAASGQQEWTRQMPAAGSSVVTGNINGKGSSDYVFGTNNGQLYALDGRAGAPNRLLWSLTIGAQVGDPALADVDADGESEVVFAAGDGYLYVVDGKE
jgi:hypothetical protein